jgi:hypothetical protein
MVTAREVPLREALHSTKTHEKMWRDLIEVGLMKPAYRGDQNAYVISLDEFERLKLIEAVRRRIEGRFTLGKLGFVLAESGQRWVPVLLMQNELKRRIQSWLGFVRRALQRHLGLSPRIGHVQEKHIYPAARKLSLRLTKKLPLKRRILAFSACYLFLTLILKMMYLRKPNPLDHAGTMRQLVVQTATMEHKDRGHIGTSFDEAARLANLFASTLRELWLVLSLDDSINILATSTHRVSDEDFWRAYDAVSLVESAFLDTYSDIRDDLKLPALSLDLRKLQRTHFLASLVAFTANPPRDREMLDELLGGSDQRLRAILSQLVTAIRIFLKAQQLLQAERRKANVK